jgi:hypothetical protein
MKSTSHGFVINAGVEVKNGRNEYPDYLKLELDKAGMLYVQRSIESSLDSGNDRIHILLDGKMKSRGLNDEWSE